VCAVREVRLGLVGLWACLWLAVDASSQDLKAGDSLPDCSKIPLLTVGSRATPADRRSLGQLPPSLESLLRADGVAIVHFCSPRAARGAAFGTFFVEELSALEKAAHGMPYPCAVVPVLPLGEKGRQDAQTLLEATETKSWGSPTIYWEPTFPRPGLYRTFRPGTSAYDDGGLTTSWTYLVGPDRRIIAVRAPGETAGLYDWLQHNLPEKVVPVARPASSTLSIAADPGSWPAFRRTLRREARAEQLPDTLGYAYLAWKASVGRTFASPAVSRDCVYAMTDTKGLHVVSLADGAPLASYAPGSSWWTSPAIAGDYVYAISAEGTVSALDSLKLGKRWEQDLHGLVTSSPTVSEGALYVGSRNGAVYALDATTGAPLWEFQTGGEISSSPAVVGGLVLIGSGDRCLYALDAASGQARWAAQTGGAVDSSPIVAGEDVFVGSFDGHLYCVALADGVIRWRCKLGGWVHSSPAVDDSHVFVGTVDIRRDEVPTFSWVDRRTGEVRGQFEVPDAIYSSPTVWGDVVVIGCRDGRVYAFDRAGRQTQPVWTYQTRGHVHASPVVVGDTVLVASYDGQLYALRQSKPVHVWKEADVVPRWFVAALVRQLHVQTADLIAAAAVGDVGVEHQLTGWETLFQQIKEQVAAPGARPKVLPRDVPPEHPGAPFVEYVLTAGLLGGYPDGTFCPSSPTTLYQFSSALASVLEWVIRPDYGWRVLKERDLGNVQVEVRAEPVAGRPPVRLADIPEQHWAKQALTFQASNQLLLVDEQGHFRGERTVTVKDAAAQWDLITQSVKVVRVR
jgi:outer membrane protein assembly factor BamB